MSSPKFSFNISAPIHQITDLSIQLSGVELFIKREDLIHPHLSGNKWRKLKYNLIEANSQGFETVLTFGGAHSNHILATAAAGNKFGFKTIGIIRGEELDENINDTLRIAVSLGMKVYFVGRNEYRKKEENDFIEDLHLKFGPFYLIPEGGANLLAVKGCSEIVNDIQIDYDYLCVASGTGTTLAGLIEGSNPIKKVLGFSSLKNGEFLYKNVRKLIGPEKENWSINNDFHFGGYAKAAPELFQFVDSFFDRTGIQLDYIYTGKMMFGIYQLIQKGYFQKGSKIIAIHTGGTQGNHAMRDRYKS